MKRYGLFAPLVFAAACTGESTNVCDEAAAVLASCGNDLDGSPFGTCQPDQEAQAAALVAAHDDGGCAAITDVKADSPLCSTLPMLCVDHSVAELEPFSTDGCSMFPDGTVGDPVMWQHCCIQHDYAYYKGGPAELRAAADAELGQCVASATGSDLLGFAMHAGVRVGGSAVLPTPWRWGYGWKYDPMNGYRAIPADQAAAADAEIARYHANPWAPDALEQRIRGLWNYIFGVPGLENAMDDVDAEINALD